MQISEFIYLFIYYKICAFKHKKLNEEFIFIIFYIYYLNILSNSTGVSCLNSKCAQLSITHIVNGAWKQKAEQNKL